MKFVGLHKNAENSKNIKLGLFFWERHGIMETYKAKHQTENKYITNWRYIDYDQSN